MSTQLTPAMRQYVEIKSRYRDCILFFRMGDFYEMFFEDAIRASRLLDIALTSRDKEANIPMCGIPYHARNAYLSKLIRQGCKVAICEQIEEPGRRRVPPVPRRVRLSGRGGGAAGRGGRRGEGAAREDPGGKARHIAVPRRRRRLFRPPEERGAAAGRP